jgi:tetratricopeptide (TPR) repeat protein
MMGLSYVALGETQKALQAFEKAAEVDPKAVEPLLNAASITVRNLGFTKTVELLDEVLKRDPENYWAKVTRPVAVRRASDDPEKTKQALDALDDLAGKDDRVEGHYNRCVIAQAVLTANKAEMQKALTACEAALKTATDKKHARAGELKKRVDTIKQTIEFTP